MDYNPKVGKLVISGALTTSPRGALGGRSKQGRAGVVGQATRILNIDSIAAKNQAWYCKDTRRSVLIVSPDSSSTRALSKTCLGKVLVAVP